jgi:hypothetical protein
MKSQQDGGGQLEAALSEGRRLRDETLGNSTRFSRGIPSATRIRKHGMQVSADQRLPLCRGPRTEIRGVDGDALASHESVKWISGCRQVLLDGLASIRRVETARPSPRLCAPVGLCHRFRLCPADRELCARAVRCILSWQADRRPGARSRPAAARPYPTARNMAECFQFSVPTIFRAPRAARVRRTSGSAR